MTRRSSKDVAFFLLGGNDIRGTLTNFEETRSAVLERSDTLGDTWEEQSWVGVRSAELSQDGFFDDDAVLGHNPLTTGPGISRGLVYGMAGTATGAEFTGWASAVEVTFAEQAARGALHKARASYKTGGPVETGKTVLTYSTPGATGGTAGVDGGAASTGAAIYLAGNASAGEANVRLQHSASAGTASYSNAVTFTKLTSGPFFERLTTTGSILRYTRVDITTATATGAIAALNLFVGLVRGLST